MASKRRTIEVDEITAPVYWASALVNGDYSGLDAHEAAWVAKWEDALYARGEWRVVSTVDDSERFTNSFDRYSGGYRDEKGTLIRGGDVIDYVIHRSPR